MESYDAVMGGPEVRFIKGDTGRENSLLLESGLGRKGHDNCPPLKGFLLSEVSIVPVTKWPPLEVPSSFVPRHKFDGPLPREVIVRAKDAMQRAALLGETPIVAQHPVKINPAQPVAAPRNLVLTKPNAAATVAIQSRYQCSFTVWLYPCCFSNIAMLLYQLPQVCLCWKTRDGSY